MVRIEKAGHLNKLHKSILKRKYKVSVKISSVVLALFMFTGCSQYKSSWSCRNPEGIGCSSISYADRIARKNIILNDDDNLEQKPRVNQQDNQNDKQKKNHKKLLIRERYSDFKKQSQAEVDFD
jgi:hypothetical protein